MADALPTYPAEEIPLTDRHWRERWATELTRANALEKQLAEARTSLDDGQFIALSNGEQLAIERVAAERLRAEHTALLGEHEQMRIERDDQRALVVKLSALNERLQGDCEMIRRDAQKRADAQRPLETRIRDLEAGLNAKERVIEMLEDADGSGLLRARKQRDAYREQLAEILRGDAGEDCLECLGEGCEDCTDGRVAR